MKPANLEEMSVKELRAVATAQGLANVSKLSRNALIDALAQSTRSGTKAAHGGRSGTDRIRNRKHATFTATSRPELSSPSSTAQANPLPPAPRQEIPPVDLPIPDQYGTDRLVLMVQDPQHVFAYWEVRSPTLERVQGQAGGAGTPVLLLHTSSGIEFREVDLRGGNYYLAVAPDASYQAELALRDAQGGLHSIARSNSVTTPAPSASSRVDEQWMGVDETFHELLELAGLPGGLVGASSAARLADKRLNLWHAEQLAEQTRSFSSGSLSSTRLSSQSLVRPAP